MILFLDALSARNVSLPELALPGVSVMRDFLDVPFRSSVTNSCSDTATIVLTTSLSVILSER